MRWTMVMVLGTLGALGLTGCFDLDAPRPECFANDPCANGAACVAGRCGAPPTRSVTLDVSDCTRDPACVAEWDAGTLCAVVQLGEAVAVQAMADPAATVEVALPDDAGAVKAAVFVRTGGGCSTALRPDAECADGCIVAWDFAAADVTAGPIALSADCASARWARHPVELCDRADQDCDGVADEDVAPEIDGCRPGVGGCARFGVMACVDGERVCMGEPGMPEPEVPSDEIDNDCDGIVDEAPPACPPGEVQPCSTACGEGELTCDADGMPGPCLDDAGDPLPEPRDEICNAIDDDCDGSTDEGFDVGEACPLGGPGCAVMGMRVCDAEGAICAGEIPPDLSETCDGGDDDCDGMIDEDFDVGDACLVGVGSCRRDGAWACDDGGAVVCEGEPGPPAVEACNGLDDDCDGSTDEGFDVGGACTRGENTCATLGVFVCQPDGVVICDAPDPQAPMPEICNTVDDDCDGVADEGLDVGAACMRGEGACVEVGMIVCGADDLAVCNAPDPRAPMPEICNAADDDCDGVADEGFGVGDACTRGEGVCAEAGVFVCDDAGGIVCNAPEPRVFMEEICNAIDDDCDDIVDEAFDFNSDPAHCGGCDINCARDNAQTNCEQRACVITSCNEGFIDANGDLEDGCECVLAGEDVPDVDGVDADCDGIDGAIDAGFFVDALVGDDANVGSPAQPLATLAAALALVTPERPHVYLSVGDHVVVEPLAMPDGVQVHGGYSGLAGGWRRVARAENVTRIDGPRLVFQFSGLTGPTLLDRLDITTPSDGATYIGVVGVEVGAHLTLREVEVRPGRGGFGLDGVVGEAAAVNLIPPTAGVGLSGGVAGRNLACPTQGGAGGANEIAGAAASDGAPGGAGGALGAAGQPGASGAAGGPGASGAGGIAAGRVDATGWQPVNGAAGEIGQAGRSGGGGGGGGNENGGARLGGGGGGGAAGGCPGGGGAQGASGGGSIGVFINGGQVRLIASRIVTAPGGSGGFGGRSAPGADGGQGAPGDPACETCGAGGPGGDGGAGGCGGPGGGGAGGPSIGVLGVGSGVPAIFEDLTGAPSAPDIVIDAAGVGGPGGEGCDGAVGGEGEAGVALPIACCVLADDGTSCAALAACEAP